MERYLTVPQLAKMTGLPKSAFYKAAQRGELTHLRNGRAVYVAESEVDRWLRKHSRGCAEEPAA